jgi:hypothetical protein
MKTVAILALLALGACTQWQSPEEPDKEAMYEQHQGGLNSGERAYAKSKQN